MGCSAIDCEYVRRELGRWGSPGAPLEFRDIRAGYAAGLCSIKTTMPVTSMSQVMNSPEVAIACPWLCRWFAAARRGFRASPAGYRGRRNPSNRQLRLCTQGSEQVQHKPECQGSALLQKRLPHGRYTRGALALRKETLWARARLELARGITRLRKLR